MSGSNDPYSEFIDHPRFGRSPHLTGLNPDADPGGNVVLHWHSPPSCRVQDTAIPADLSRQSPATVAVTHYFDVTRKCQDCGGMFIFFAAEQKHWYEDLGFGLDSNCIRCVPCRKHQQGIAKARERYQELFHIQQRSTEEHLEMAEFCLDLIESRVFSIRQTQHVRKLLNLVGNQPTHSHRHKDIENRLSLLESKAPE